MIYKKIIRPLLFRFDPEKTHTFVSKLLKAFPFGPRAVLPFKRYRSDHLKVTLFGLTFPNPVGLAAGFDKDAELLDVWPALGFGFMEVGTVTARAQPGNDKPRLFRYPNDRALINRMGFNNQGADAMLRRFEHRAKKKVSGSIPVGINIGKSKVVPVDKAVPDYLYSFDLLYPFGDYFVINVSSPNTPGLRELQDRPALKELLAAVSQMNRQRQNKPLLVKIAPDLSELQLDDVLEVVLAVGLSGIVATNTTLSRENLTSVSAETGGLSGAPLARKSTEVIRYLRRASSGKLPIIGVGGIFSAEDVAEKLDAGASLVQLYSGLVFEGPMVVHQIKKGLLAFDASNNSNTA